MDTLAFADKNKNNRELIDQVLEKARQRKGLSHREAILLLDCELEDKNQEIFALWYSSYQIFSNNGGAF